MKNNNKLIAAAIKLHETMPGKIGTKITIPFHNYHDLALAYTPGVASISQKIYQNPEDIYKYTIKNNTVGVITNGTAVLGLGDVGPGAALPVMEGKCLLLKKFANVNAFPICIDSKDSNTMIDIIEKIATSFGAINLEDIAAPECFTIEEALNKRLNIPIFHDDRHGTAIVIGAVLLNCCRLTSCKLSELTVCCAGLGSAGLETIRFLYQLGVRQIYGFDKNGVINQQNLHNFNPYIQTAVQNKIIQLADNSVKTLSDLIKGKKVFFGLSIGNLLTATDVKNMAHHPWVFPLANPVPEINPDIAKQAGAEIIGSGSNLYENQINNALIFPSILSAALKLQNVKIDTALKLTACHSLANLIPTSELKRDYIIPKIFNPHLNEQVVKTILEKYHKW